MPYLPGFHVKPAAGSNVARNGLLFRDLLVVDRTVAGSPTSTQKATLSAFFETGAVLPSEGDIFFTGLSTGVLFDDSGNLLIVAGDGFRVKNGIVPINTRNYILAAFDSTQIVDADRWRVWLGTYGGSVAEITSWDTDVPISLNADLQIFSNGSPLYNGNGQTGAMADIYWLDGQYLADPTTFVAGNVKPIAASVTFGDEGAHLDFGDTGQIGKDVSGNGNHFVASERATLGSVLTVTSQIGSMTGGGGLASAFDGTTNQAIAASASLSGNNAGYVGADFSAAAKRVYKAEIWGTNDQGYVTGANPSVSLSMRTKATLPANVGDGTFQGSTTFTDTANESGNVRTINCSDQFTAFEYVFIGTSTHNAVKGIAEIKFYESVLDELGAGDVVTPYL